MVNGKDKRVMHIAGDGLLQGTGFSQQISMEVHQLKRDCYDVSVLAFCHIKYTRKKEIINKLRENYERKGIPVYIVPTFFGGRFLLEFIYYPIAFFVILYFVIFKKINIFHIHTYNFILMLLPLKHFMSKKIKVLNDIHGVVIEESIYRGSFNQGSYIHRYYNLKEKLAFQCADLHFCVSQEMINYYAMKHDLSFNRFALTRSSFDPEIFKTFSFELKKRSKKLLGLNGKKVLLYMGHKQAWQQTREVVNLHAVLKEHLPELYFIFLTNDMEGIRKEYQRLGIPETDYLVRYVPHDEVPRYSYAADAAILMRSKSIVNNVASPVKFSEYLASGAVVLMSPTIGDLPSIVKKFNIGLVLTGNNFHELIFYLKAIFKSGENQEVLANKCREVAEREFSVSNAVDVFKQSYEC